MTAAAPETPATPGQAGHPLDLPAMAAYAVFRELDAAEAAEAFQRTAESVRVQFRAIADAVLMVRDLAARQPQAALEAVPWRQGRSQPRNVYARTGGDDWKADTMIGQLDTPELAAEAVTAHNAARQPQAAPGLPFCRDAEPVMAPAVARPSFGSTLVLAIHPDQDDETARKGEEAIKAATARDGVTVVAVRGVEALRMWEPQPAPELAACEVAIEQITRMCQRPRETAGTSQGAVVNGERLAGLVLAVIKAAGLEGK